MKTNNFTLLAVLVSLCSPAAFANPCLVALSAKQAEMVQAPLATFGFQQIDASSFYEFGQFIAHVDDSQKDSKVTPRLYTPMYGLNDYSKVVGIKRRTNYGRPSMAFLTPDSNGGYGVVEFGSGGGGHTTFKMDPTQYVGKPLHQQLADSKFTLVPGTTDLYRFAQEEDDSTTPALVAAEVLIRLKNGVIVNVYTDYGMSFLSKDLQKMPYRIVGARISKPQYSYDKPSTVLDLTNGLMTFSVSSGSYRYPSNIRLQTDLAQVPQELLDQRILAIGPVVDRSSGFVVGRVNTTELIQGLTSLHDNGIEDIENEMQQHYLASNEELLPIMVADNKLVVDTWGTYHQALAAPFLTIIAAVEAGVVEREFTLNGIAFRIDNGYAIRGMVSSPFDSNTGLSNKGGTLVRVDTGQKLHVSYAQIELIARYGFYGSLRDPQRRVDPVALRQMFAPATATGNSP